MQYLEYEDIKALKPRLTEEEYLEVLYYNYPSLWIEDHIPDPMDTDRLIKLRPYQTNIINKHDNKKMMRMGRQIGKSLLLQCITLYFGIKRKGSRILLIGPQRTHIDQLFDEIQKLIEASEYLKSEVRSIIQQPRRIKFKNGNTALGMTTGESSGGKGLNIRGKTGNVLIIDEADYINDYVMENVILPTTNAFHPSEVHAFMSSTPTGRRGFFRRMWDSGNYAVFHHKASESPNWTQEKESEIRSSITKLAYTHEYDANWGDSESGLFNKEDLRMAIEKSKLPFPDAKSPEGIIHRGYTYNDDRVVLDSIIKPKYNILGVDWNKATNGTRLIWTSFDEYHNMYQRGKWKIDAVEFTQNTAMQKIRELHEAIRFDYIMVDVGYGSVQIEDLHLYGKMHPETKLDKVVIGVATDSGIEIKDIATGETRNTPIKNFIVESMVRFTEQHRLRMPVEEAITENKKAAASDVFTLSDQLNNYIISRYTANGRPVYECDATDHDVDALMFALYGYITQVIKTQNLWEKVPSAHPKTISYDKILKNISKKKEDEQNNMNPTNRVVAHNTYRNQYISNGIAARSINRRPGFRIGNVGRSGISRGISR